MREGNDSVKLRSLPQDKKVLAACTAITALVYLPTLRNYLVADSWVFMMPHSFFEVFGYFFKTMLPPEFNALWLRPLPMFTYWLDTVLWPGTSWGPHLVNVLFHCVNVWLVWLLVGTIAKASGGASSKRGLTLGLAAACLVYGLHPLNVGSVAWVGARFDVMCVTFGLAGMILWVKWDAGGAGKRLLPASAALLLAGLLSKEQGIVFIASCFVLSLAGLHAAKDRRRRFTGCAALAGLTVGYVLFRLLVFKGLGGYLEARHGLSMKPPVFYFVALFHPFRNVIEDPSFSLTMALGVLMLAGLGAYLWKTAGTAGNKRRGIPYVYFLCAAALCLFGLATNAPNPGMTFDKIMGHAESRFALNAVTGLSLLAGLTVMRFGRSDGAYKAVLAVILIWSAASVWRTDVQIQAWRDAGETAEAIVEDTLREAPDPPPNSRLIFFDIPLTNDQWAYIFGIGLEEALMLRYRRSDIDIVRYPKRSDLRSARPDRDYVFRYDERTHRLERLHAERQKQQQ